MPRAKYRSDRRVNEYIKSLPSWQQKVCWQVRDLVHAADADVSETIKRTKLPYFTLDGNVCALLGTKDHVNIFIYDPIAPDPEGIINQGKANSAARAIQVYEFSQNRFFNDLTEPRGLPKFAEVVQDIAFCGLDCGLRI